ncbi:Pro-Pol polyprotein [Trachymyrmex cornetzi]|uniref:Pro-Pol polyprotein n=1 Tax=Trachymyrmex cornetzi TaxID=471704 RepID=A0A151J5T7_9HYME|nr:Pro-Pol polyprotein [Trachymyrmex cornetzi]
MKTERIDSITWKYVLEKFRNTFIERPTIISVCRGAIITPPIEDRVKIITEYHESAVGGHKGVTKTYLRIKQQYNWNNLKTQIQDFIRKCKT